MCTLAWAGGRDSAEAAAGRILCMIALPTCRRVRCSKPCPFLSIRCALTISPLNLISICTGSSAGTWAAGRGGSGSGSSSRRQAGGTVHVAGHFFLHDPSRPIHSTQLQVGIQILTNESYEAVGEWETGVATGQGLSRCGSRGFGRRRHAHRTLAWRC